MFLKREKHLLLSIFAVTVFSFFLMTSCAGKKVITEEPAAPETMTEEQITAPAEVKEESAVEEEIDEEVLREEMIKKIADKIQDLFFAFDSYDLSETAKSKLQNIASILKVNTGVNILIEGHCDERGTVEYNLVLGEKRASSAKSYLVNLGVSNDRVNTISYGEESPFDSAHNEIAWAKNRRAHFVLK